MDKDQAAKAGVSGVNHFDAFAGDQTVRLGIEMYDLKCMYPSMSSVDDPGFGYPFSPSTAL